MKKLIAKAQKDSTVLRLMLLVVFMLGVITGFLFSPIKNGLTIASNNTIISGDDDRKKIEP